jgi:hypothetical protein
MLPRAERDILLRVFELKPSIEESRGRVLFNRFMAAAPRFVVGALFILIGYTKFDDNPRGEWVRIFELIGFGQWFRYFTGVVQITGGLLMAVRRTLTVGAAMLACTMVGAAAVDVFLLGSPLVIAPLLLLIIIATVWVAAT